MSHFVVVVIGDDYEGQLAPFAEQSDNPQDDEYFTFKNFSTSEEEKQEYENKQVDLVDYQGKVFSKFDDKFYVTKTGSYQREVVLPEGAVVREGSIKELYPTYDEYLKDYCGYNYNEEHDAYGYWYNPQAKWDWYV